ncbi:TatD family hydrolase [Amphibacillus jilinensis]|uniref:TatD family hydrolase n=1 Tax=Amphibacillus jilinensis TaxID=1216008 RepID=UPI000307323E|nr:TatD family hydrolase [Amphibacillus jilinensis]
MLFDTHVHLNVDHFNEDREAVIQRAVEAGVTEMVVVGFDHDTIPKAIQLAEQYDFIYAAVGWHPVDAVDFTGEELQWLEKLASHPKVVALGEMGLDYYWDKSPKHVQQDVFRQQIQLAKKVDLPIIIHNREATEDIVSILQEEQAETTGGIMHCYNDGPEYVQACLEMNFYISLGGPVTFKNAKLPKEVAKIVPIDRLLIETDCPFLAPHPNRGKRNEPAYVTLVADHIAELRGMTRDEVGRATTANAHRLFGLDEVK